MRRWALTAGGGGGGGWEGVACLFGGTLSRTRAPPHFITRLARAPLPPPPGDKLKDITGRQQAAAGMGIYGPRTVYLIAITGYPGTHEFLLMDDGKWVHVKETTKIGERARARACVCAWVGG